MRSRSGRASVQTYPVHVELVLVVDDDTTVSGVVAAYLERVGLAVEVVADGLDAVHSASVRRPDLVLLDLMLPGLDGLEVCRRLQAMHPGLPVIMLTARGQEHDRILGLELGADDYVTKPFSPRELVLRAQSILRRVAATAVGGSAGTGAAGIVGVEATGPDARTRDLVDGDLRIDVAGRRVHLGSREPALTTREFDLLAWFVAHPGRVFTRTELMSRVWGWDYGDESTVTVHVRRVREKVEADPATPRRLVTVFGVGYRWDGAADEVSG
jgi:DNA-binding response OmpR family regulator